MEQLLCFEWNDNIESTSWFRDTLYTSINDLVKILGDPEFIPDETEKVQYEWNLIYKDIPFTIYDWKEYRFFKTDEYINWHIGARNKEESNYITKILKEKLNELNN